MDPHRTPSWNGRYAMARVVALVGILTGLAAAGKAAVEPDPTFQFPANADLQSVNWCHLLPDGRILAGGDKTFRLTSSGALDSSYPILTMRGGFLQKPVLAPDGGFTAFGSYTDENWNLHSIGRRYTSTGAIDSAFQPDLGDFANVSISKRDANGGYLVSGRFLPGVNRAGLIRLDSNGAVDPAFQKLVSFSVSGLESLIDGSWIVTGTTLTPEGFADSDRIMRLASDGTVLSDQEAEDGPGNAVTTRRLIPRSARSFIFCGEGPLIGVLGLSGKLDPSFRHVWGEGPSDPSASAVVRTRSGRYITALKTPTPYFAHTKEWPLPDGAANWPGATVFRTLPDGMIDLSFDFNAATQNEFTQAYDLVLQRDGKFIVADGAKLRRFRETRSPAVFAFGEKAVVVGERERFARCTLYRAGDVSSPGAVTLSSLNTEITAIRGGDYVPVHRRVRFAAGEWKRTILVPLQNDRRRDGAKAIVLRLTNPDSRSTLYDVTDFKIIILDGDAGIVNTR